METLLFLMLTVTLCACDVKPETPPAKLAEPCPRCRSLIPQLVMDTSLDYSLEEKRIVGVMEKLKGREHLNCLTYAFRDTRPSFGCYRAVMNPTVGFACEKLVEWQLLTKGDWVRSRFMRGRDTYYPTPWHEAPLTIFKNEPLDLWVRNRSDSSLKELQIEILEALISDLNAIGFYDYKTEQYSAELENEIMTPLKSELEKLRAN